MWSASVTVSVAVARQRKVETDTDRVVFGGQHTPATASLPAGRGIDRWDRPAVDCGTL